MWREKNHLSTLGFFYDDDVMNYVDVDVWHDLTLVFAWPFFVFSFSLCLSDWGRGEGGIHLL